jgi:hypothetical protein
MPQQGPPQSSQYGQPPYGASQGAPVGHYEPAQRGWQEQPLQDGAAYGQLRQQRAAQGSGSRQTTGGGSDGNNKPRVIGALILVVVALIITGLSANWIWTKADAVAPVDLPSANPTPLKTVSPSIQPTATPPPTGKVIGSQLFASNNDTMPLMGSAWLDADDKSGQYGGVAIWLPVHNNYDGKKSNWGNYVSFGALNKQIPYTNTAAGRKDAAIQAATNALFALYADNPKLIGKAVHRQLTVGGHPAHEITAKVEIKVPKLKETFSTLMITLIDRGDGTADVAIGDIAGSTPQWLPIWRTKVSQIQINS